MRKKLLKKGIAALCCGLLIGLGMTIYTSCAKEDAHKELSENIAQNTHKYKAEVHDVDMDMSSKKSRLNELMGDLSGLNGEEALAYLSNGISFDYNNIEYKKIINLKNSRSNKRDYRFFMIAQTSIQKTDDITFYNAFLEIQGKIIWGIFMKAESMSSGISKLTLYNLSWQELSSFIIDFNNRGKIIEKHPGQHYKKSRAWTMEVNEENCGDGLEECTVHCVDVDYGSESEVCEVIQEIVQCTPEGLMVSIIFCAASCADNCSGYW